MILSRKRKRLLLVFLLCSSAIYIFILAPMDTGYEAADERSWVDFPVNYSHLITRFNFDVTKEIRSGDTGERNWALGNCSLESPESIRKDVVDLRVIVITYNRPQSLDRLLQSLNKAEYDNDNVKFEIWLDRSIYGQISKDTLTTARNFRVSYGRCSIIVHSTHVGIQGQWLNTWEPSAQSREMAVILEDDLTVSPFFYKYLKLVHNKYDSRRDVSGFSLQGTSLRHSDGHCCLNVATENKVFLYPTLGTTGFSPKRDSWFMFKSWLNHITSNGQRPPLIKDHVAVTWYEDLRRLGHEESMWEMGYLYYTRMQGEYTLYPNFKDHQGLTVNWFEVGLHNKGKMEEDSNGKPENGLLRSWNPQYDQLPDEPIYVNNNGDVIS